jgi:hypothetical protein
MKNQRNITLGICLICATLTTAAAQEEYTWEMGAALGGSYYMGDANSTTPFKHTGLAGGFIARYLLNPHMAIKGNLVAGHISGDTRDFANAYPQGAYSTFSRTLVDAGVQYEYNFFGYGEGNNYRGNHRFTPYITGGIGLTFAPKPAETLFTLNVPLGIGVKYKLAHRLNIGCELTMRFSLSDRLDVTNREGLQLDSPYQIKGKGWKNKDSYSLALLFVTYDLFPRCKECNQ